MAVDLNRVLFSFSIVVVASVLVLGVALGEDSRFMFLAVYVCAVGISAISVIRFADANIRVGELSKHIEGRLTKAFGGNGGVDGTLELLIKRTVSPSIEKVQGLDAVCAMTAEAIDEAHRAEKESDRFITFYGSASLSTIDPGRLRFGRQAIDREADDEDRVAPEDIYAGALEAAASDQIRVRRYIRLFEAVEFRRRGSALQEEYLFWLRKQIYQLNRNPHYRLIHVVRAPAWASGMARIVTHSQLVDIIADGEAAVIIRGPQIVGNIRREMRKSMLGRKMAANAPIHYGKEYPWHQFVGRWANLKEFGATWLNPLEDVYREITQEGHH